MSEEREKIKVAILDAKYYQDERWLVVNVETPRGERRTCTIPTSNVYKGNKVSDEEAHQQMEVLAKMFNQNRGRKLMMVADEEQIS